jgi:hypothetical protein
MHLRSRKLKTRESKGTPPPSPTEEQSPGSSPSSTSPENSPNSISGEQFEIFRNLFNFSDPRMEDTFNPKTARGNISSFDGTPSEFSRFIETCDLAYESKTTDNDEREFLTLILSKMSTPVYNVARSNGSATWEVVKNTLIEKYGIKQTRPELLAELSQLRQTHSVAAFGEKIMDTLMSLSKATEIEFPDQETGTMEIADRALALSIFLNGLKPSIGGHIRAQKPNSLTTAIQEAQREESAQARNAPKVKSEPPPSASEARPVNTGGSGQSGGAYQRFRNQNDRFQIKKEPGCCTYCGSPDHVISDCPDPNCRVARRNKGTGQQNRQVNQVRVRHQGNGSTRNTEMAVLQAQMAELKSFLVPRAPVGYYPVPQAPPSNMVSASRMPQPYFPPGARAPHPQQTQGNGVAPAAQGHAGATR